MSKRLIVCCDGTWNKPDQLASGVHAPTNVAKLALGVATEDSDGVAQVLHYQRGVGTKRSERVRGGVFGYGLSRNVRDCYRFVVEHYEPGDELYFFGFSRGAYTARSTVGLIRNCGILRREHSDLINKAYRLYRSRADRRRPTGVESQVFARMYSHADVDIDFIGVWDTVGSLGIPISGLRLPFVERLWGFHNTELSRHVRSAYQALAIDEQRKPFKPALWTQHDDAQDQILEQVWFSGVHCDVGGGYREPELSEIALLWMVDRARSRGLAFRPDHFVVSEPPASEELDVNEPRWLGERVSPNANGTIHDSYRDACHGLYRLLGRHPRRLTAGDQQSVATSAISRLRTHPGYAPAGLVQWVALGWPATWVQDRVVAPRAEHARALADVLAWEARAMIAAVAPERRPRL